MKTRFPILAVSILFHGLYCLYVFAGGGIAEVSYAQFPASQGCSDPPQFYNAHTQKWITIPVYDRNEIRRYKQDNGYLGYIEHYHAYAYFMFKAVYKETRGVEYPDNLEGEIP